MENVTVENSNQNLFDIQFKNMLYSMSKNMNFVGILNIVFGALSCLSIIGAIVGVPQIIAGIRLRDANDKLKYFFSDENDVYFKDSLGHIAKYFEMTKIIFIINLVVIALVVVLYVALFAFFGEMILNEVNANV